MQHREIYREYGEAVFGMGENELYELERALRRHERFPRTTRSGPGGGVQASPLTISMLVMAALIDGPRAAMAHRMDGYLSAVTENTYLEDWESAPSPHSIPCGLTGQLKFGAALQKVFESDDCAGRTMAIRVNRSAIEAFIDFTGDHGKPTGTRFIHPGIKGRRLVKELETAGTLQSRAYIGRTAILTLRTILKHGEASRNEALKQALAQIDAVFGGRVARK